MTRADISLACAVSLVDELVAHGLRHVCVSPGSRSTALALAFARRPEVAVHVNLDERSSAFFALGLVRGSRIPAAAVCTSGTAAAEFFPAVVEASQSAAPLFLLTADRPPRLRGTGANQTIDQVNLYGAYARAYLEPPVPTSPEDVVAWRAIARQAVVAALSTRPGPVHINCPFDEPLVPAGRAIKPAPPDTTSVAGPDRIADPPDVAQDVAQMAAEIQGVRGVMVIGPSPWAPPHQAVMLAEQIGWPVMAEPASGVRRRGARPQVVLAAGQALARSPGFMNRHVPELVLQLGATPTSRATQELVASAKRLVVIDRDHLDPDPEGHAALKVAADPQELATALLGVWITGPVEAWIQEWMAADDMARRTIDEALDAVSEPTELRLARDLAAWIPSGGTLFAGNSMPIRDLDYAMAPQLGLRVIANRGASGIDGLVSTALGVAVSAKDAAEDAEGPTLALIGDLSLLHDAGALLWNGARGPDITFVVPNNGGGTIFSFMDQSRLPELEDLFTTPHRLDLETLCAAARVGHTRVTDIRDLPSALKQSVTAGGVRLVEVMIDSERSRNQHAEIQDLVDSALRPLA